MKGKVFYLSGKISGVPDLNVAKFKHCQNRLHFVYGTEIIVINPHELPALHDKSWASYMKVCIRHLTRADYVCVLDDWKSSRGAIIEVFLAWFLAIPVVYMDVYKRVDVDLSLYQRALLVFKLFRNRFANAKDYQAKQ